MFTDSYEYCLEMMNQHDTVDFLCGTENSTGNDYEWEWYEDDDVHDVDGYCNPVEYRCGINDNKITADMIEKEVEEWFENMAELGAAEL